MDMNNFNVNLYVPLFYSAINNNFITDSINNTNVIHKEENNDNDINDIFGMIIQT